ncbi:MULTISPECIES: TRAP transporter large permease [Halomonas]|uniref:TRAP transporter large permease protein n=1 Tax=Halomonas litopenaei TaxID=2109328 RepID=A0ABX5J620_9GAMM|nr:MULTISPECIES: TRAP transporter large permease [Halomonas]MBR9877896.1 TRAP transporter large permease [Gammaproteobacteria bacterium]KJZ17140.1 C4-dicarboxylate ABC transporter permease [Halomonas sp. S2151]MAR73022.1 TRAP transporter large permease [Halomonas sp.]MBY5939922.1 TRAP transporter large permease [Halomonas sp. DP5N14-9]MBY6109488.1 TRAP transporter large permease [Halomonas sp. DP1Y21-3]|tara:strand:+ start:2052 stop:3326 length:1275 start_codon:yes stop_codon:yes gene_type:complete
MNAAIGLSLIILFALGVPIAVSILLASVIGIEFFTRFPLLMVPQQMFVGIDNFPLMAIPFFILAGNLMAAGGISQRLVDLAKSIVGGLQGGLAMTCVLTCMMFAAVSGSSVATTFAIGSILIPAMVAHDYPRPLAASIQASSAELGVLIPPSIPLILYGVSTDTSIGRLFIAGIGPGLLIGSALLLFLYIFCKLRGYGLRDREDRAAFTTSMRRAWAALLMPVVVIGGIYGGVFTPTEASAVAVFYALIVGGLVYRELPLSELVPILRQSVISTATVMLIISAAALFSFLISRSGLPGEVAAWVTQVFESPVSFLLAVNVMLLVIGMFVETSAAILVLAPIFTPIAVQYGIDPVHFGLIVVVNLALGMFTPPLGVNLFAACAVAKLSIDELIPWLARFVLVVLACLMAITYMPWISLGLVDLLY